MTTRILIAATVFSTLAGCAATPPMTMPMFSQAALPDAVMVPAGHAVVMETVGVGEITYECKAKAVAGAAATTMAGEFEWVFVGPKAVLNDRSGKPVGSYFGPPATWQAADGSRITGTQLAVAPSSPGNIPLQLVKANPAMGNGAMTGISHIQRVATQGGVAPALPCAAASMGQKQVVPYRADYIFYRAM